MDFNIYTETLKSLGYYIYALCEVDGEKRLPFYIGKGQNTRCLNHLRQHLHVYRYDPQGLRSVDTPKTRKIKKLKENGRLGIDILCHHIESERIALQIEAACISLIGKDNLTNLSSGASHETMRRFSLEDLHALKQESNAPKFQGAFGHILEPDEMAMRGHQKRRENFKLYCGATQLLQKLKAGFLEISQSGKKPCLRLMGDYLNTPSSAFPWPLYTRRGREWTAQHVQHTVLHLTKCFDYSGNAMAVIAKIAYDPEVVI